MLMVKFVKIIRTFSLIIVFLFLLKHCIYYNSTRVTFPPIGGQHGISVPNMLTNCVAREDSDLECIWSKYDGVGNKNNLRTIWASNWNENKNIQHRIKITGSYKKNSVHDPAKWVLFRTSDPRLKTRVIAIILQFRNIGWCFSYF